MRTENLGGRVDLVDVEACDVENVEIYYRCDDDNRSIDYILCCHLADCVNVDSVPAALFVLVSLVSGESPAAPVQWDHEW